MSNWNAQVFVKWKPNAKANQSWEWAKTQKWVKSAWSVMGDWDMILWVDAESPDQLEDFVVNGLRNQEWVGDTRSWWTHEMWNRAA